MYIGIGPGAFFSYAIPQTADTLGHFIKREADAIPTKGASASDYDNV